MKPARAGNFHLPVHCFGGPVIIRIRPGRNSGPKYTWDARVDDLNKALPDVDNS